MHVIRRALVALAMIAAATTVAGLAGTAPAQALNNGLALTPPMGWNDWNAFGCNVSEQLVEQTAQIMVSSGMKAAGYQYVNIDDCWMNSSRSSSGHLVPNPSKFPDGISGVATYVHNLGLKLGIYEDAGTSTCAGYPGSLGHETTDADDFAAWGVDYLKYDNCNAGSQSAQTRYTTMKNALAASGRNIVFSLCNWGQENVWTWGAGVGNLWRTTGDISASFSSMLSNFHSNVSLYSYAGPGAWNDPDMLEVGNSGLSATENQTEVSLWAEMAAPLISGTDLRNASSATLADYTNANVIAVDQDSLGVQGHEVASSGGHDVLTKALANGDVAVVLFNENSSAATISTTASAVGAASASSYQLTDLWSNAVTTTSGSISASVPGHGVVMYRVHAGSGGGGGSNTVTVTNPGSQTGTVGTAASLQIHATDSASGQTLTYSATGLPAGLSISSSSGLISGTPTTAGTSNVTVTATDTTGAHGSASFSWTINGSGGVTTYELVGTSSGRCLDVKGSGTSDGTPVDIYDCNAGANQEWNFTAANELRVYGGTKCLDVTNGGTSAGTKLDLHSCTGAANQQFRLNSDGTITAIQSNLCVDVTGGNVPSGNVNGVLVEIWSCNGQTNQKWTER